MEFQTQAQQDCFKKVEGWMDDLFGHIPWETLDQPGVGLFMGSAWVEVRLYPWKDDAMINIRSTVVSGANIDATLQTFLLRENADLRFGAFSLSESNDILFEHTIVGSTCDPQELEASVLAVLQAADDYDDKIVENWGGKRALDQRPEE
ncbi:MAG: YbjN domain-containing protein [Thermosynechococcaceae cyanobacterium]